MMNIEKTDHPYQDALKGIEAFREYIVNDLHLPQYIDELINEEVNFEVMIHKALKGQNSLSFAYRELNKEDILTIYQMCMR